MAGADNQYYVYEHWRPDTGLPFYVGKGRRRRAFELKYRERHHKCIQAKLECLGLQVEIRKVFTYLDEDTAFTLESSQIAYWRSRGINLTNLTSGGDGVSGYRWTEKQRSKQSTTLKNLPPDVWGKIKAALSKAHKGKVMGEASRKKMSVSQTGRKHAEPTKQKMRERALKREARKRELGIKQNRPLNFKHTPENKEVFRLAALRTVERKRRLGLPLGRTPGFIVSAETREKLRAAAERRRLASITASP